MMYVVLSYQLTNTKQSKFHLEKQTTQNHQNVIKYDVCNIQYIPVIMHMVTSLLWTGQVRLHALWANSCKKQFFIVSMKSDIQSYSSRMQ